MIRETQADLDLGVVGNCAFAALIDRRASVAWACMPRLDGDPVFAGLLGPVAIAAGAVVLGLPVWIAWWWLARHG